MGESSKAGSLRVRAGLVYGFAITDEMLDGHATPYDAVADAYTAAIADRLFSGGEGSYRGVRVFADGYDDNGLHACGAIYYIGVEVKVLGGSDAPVADPAVRNIVDDLAGSVHADAGYHVIAAITEQQ